jgi:cell fate (sporulation/competence/biofilm development) regulator YlbF (YheA/YmcA/DUF963 family)
LEQYANTSNNAIARSKVTYDGNDSQFWIVNVENTGGVRFVENITGFKTGTQEGNRTTITEDGMPIYKNTKLGEILIRNHEGRHFNLTPKGEISFEIFNRAIYKPINNEIDYASEIVIQAAGDLRVYSFRTLQEILKEAERFQKDIEELEKLKETATKLEAIELVNRIKEKENEKKSILREGTKLHPEICRITLPTNPRSSTRGD